MENFAGLSAVTRVILIFAMWIGRLEVMTVLILLHPDVLRTLFQPHRRPPV
jgi:Trk-type K+ transport system membrane component